MNLDPDAVQLRLAEATAALARHDDALPRLAGLGLFRLDLPLDVEGLDLGVAASVVAGLELGRAMRPLPGYRETVFAAHLLHAAGATELLAPAGRGEHLIATVGLRSSSTVRLDDEGRLHGESEPLPAAPWKSAVVRARTPNGPALVLVPVDAAVSAGGSRLSFTATAGTPLPGITDADIEGHGDAAFLRHAAFLLGLADAALSLARDHCRRRQQFGRPLIDFQTVSHRLAALSAEAEGLVLLAHEAAWRHDTGLPCGPYPAQTLAAAADHALATTRLAVQLHGARGIVAGDPPELAYRLAATESTRLGTPQALWQLAGLRRLAGQPGRPAANSASKASGGSRNV
ncbi:MAG TPA: acyl-CoA dehydrogenase [Pseudonocardiaceae bacterium]